MRVEMLLALWLLIQTNLVGPYPTVVWSQPATTLAEAQSFTYKYHLDGATTGAPLTGVTCSGSTTFECQAKLPVTIPGPHTVAITTTNSNGSAPISPSATFEIEVAVPTAPKNVTIKE